MRFRMSLLVGAVLLSLVLSGSHVAVQGAPDGLPTLVTEWEGTAKSTIYETETGGGKEKEKIGITVTFVQAGPELTATIATPDDPVTPPIIVTGTIGNGHFILASEPNPEEMFVMVGHVKSSGKKIKGTGFSSVESGSEITEFSFKLKQAD